MANDNKDTLKKTFLFWVIFILIIFIAFLACKNKIFRVLGETDFCNQVFKSTPQWIAKEIAKVLPENEVSVELQDEELDESTLVLETNIEEKKFNLKNIERTIKPDKSLIEAIEPVTKISEDIIQKQKNVFPTVQSEKIEKNQEKIGVSSIEKNISKELANDQNNSSYSTDITKLLLCYVIIDNDGTVIRYEMERTVPKTRTPLTVAINLLLQGPTITELEKGYMTLIPQNTKLLGASVSNRVATLNFSEEFIQNKYGVEGYIGQLMQIVYTATSFSSIDSVQFLIAGEKKEYLGSEGVWIGSPLARATFR